MRGQNRFLDFLIDHDGFFIQKVFGKVNKYNAIFFSVSVKNMLLIARAGSDNVVYHVPLLGIILKETLLEGVKRDLRYASYECEGIPKVVGVHDYREDETISPVNIAHDFYHAELMSMIPKNYRLAILNMQQQVSILLQEMPNKPKWSLISWLLADMEFEFFVRKHRFDCEEEYSEAGFCAMASYGGGGRVVERHSLGMLTTIKNMTSQYEIFGPITDFGIIIFFDMVVNRDVWLKHFNINCEKLSPPYSKYYDKMKGVIQGINPDESALIKILKFRFYDTFNSMELYLSFCEICNNFKACVFDSFRMIRWNNENFLGYCYISDDGIKLDIRDHFNYVLICVLQKQFSEDAFFSNVLNKVKYILFFVDKFHNKLFVKPNDEELNQFEEAILQLPKELWSLPIAIRTLIQSIYDKEENLIQSCLAQFKSKPINHTNKKRNPCVLL